MSVIGFDLDDTLAPLKEWRGGETVGQPDPEAVRLLRTLHEAGHTVCLWTCRAAYVAEAWLRAHDLRKFVTYVNASPYPTESGKASFDFYIGDEAIHWNGRNADTILEFISANSTREFVFEREVAFSSDNPKLYHAGVGRNYVDMFENEWKRAWEQHDRNGKEIAFLTICSHAKPYSKSFIHGSIRRHLQEHKWLDKVDYAHISNAGIIPTSAEMTYPFNAYDWNGELASQEVKEYHKKAIRRRMWEWLDNYGKNYRHKFVFLRDGGNTCNVVSHMIAHGARFELVQADTHDHNYPTFMAVQDQDDCLVAPMNLLKLTNKIKEIVDA